MVRVDLNTPHRKQLEWLTVGMRRCYFTSCLTFEILNTNTPNNLANLFTEYVSIRPVRGEVQPLVILKFKTGSLRFSFHIAAWYIWNQLLYSIRNSTSSLIFKRKVFDYFFNIDGAIKLKTILKKYWKVISKTVEVPYLSYNFSTLI